MRHVRSILVTAVVIVLAGGAAQAGLTDGLYAYYDFNGNTVDQTGSGNLGLDDDVAFVTDGLAGMRHAMEFNGTTSGVNVPDSVGSTSAGSVSVWFKPDALAAGGQNKMLFSARDSGTRYLYISKSTGDLIGTIDNTNISLGNPTLNQWNHAVLTWDNTGGNSTASLYLNGASQSASGITTNAIAYGAIGRHYDNARSYYDGTMDDVGFWNRALTPSEVASLYNGGTAEQITATGPIGTPSGWGSFTGEWTRRDTPVMPGSQMGTGYVQNGKVFELNGTYYVPTHSFGGSDYYTELASSTDMVTWTQTNGGNPILTPTETWEDSYAQGKATLVDGNEVKMYYFGKDGTDEKVGLATASTSDLTSWSKYGSNPIFDASDSNIDGTRCFPSDVFKEDGTYYMYYSVGRDYYDPNLRGYRIGVATSADGINWTDSANSPILDLGDIGQWDSGFITAADVVKEGEYYYMLYSAVGDGSNDTKIGQAFGLARSLTPDGVFEKYPLNPIFTIDPDSAWQDNFVQNPSLKLIDGEWNLLFSAHGDESSYQVGLATLTAIPEPATLALLGLGGVALAIRRRRA